MEQTIGIIGALFFFILMLGLTWSRIRLFDSPAASIAPVAATMGLIGLCLPFILVGIFGAGLEALLYLYISTIMIVLYWLITLFMLLVKYSRDHEGRFFIGNAIYAFLILVVIPLMWALGGSGGSYKFWGEWIFNYQSNYWKSIKNSKFQFVV